MISYLAFEDEIGSPVKRNQQRIGNGKIHSLLAKLLLSATNWHIIKKSRLMKQLNKKTSLSLSKTSHQEVVCQINHREGKTKGNPNFRLKTEVRVSDVVSSPAGTCRLVDLVSAFLLAVPNWLTSGRVMLILSFAFDLLV